jgi:hypothetical protein
VEPASEGAAEAEEDVAPPVRRGGAAFAFARNNWCSSGVSKRLYMGLACALASPPWIGDATPARRCPYPLETTLCDDDNERDDDEEEDDATPAADTVVLLFPDAAPPGMGPI